MGALRTNDLGAHINELVLVKKKPTLGICLGMQLVAKVGYEYGVTSGFGWVDAEVKPLNAVGEHKVPNVGWCAVEPTRSSDLFQSMPDAPDFYFVHSYQMICKDAGNVLAVTQHSEPVTATVEYENIVATQFHPEKSQDQWSYLSRKLVVSDVMNGKENYPQIFNQRRTVS